MMEAFWILTTLFRGIEITFRSEDIMVPESGPPKVPKMGTELKKKEEPPFIEDLRNKRTDKNLVKCNKHCEIIFSN